MLGRGVKGEERGVGVDDVEIGWGGGEMEEGKGGGVGKGKRVKVWGKNRVEVVI